MGIQLKLEHATTQYNLGLCYINGIEVEQDIKKGVGYGTSIK